MRFIRNQLRWVMVAVSLVLCAVTHAATRLEMTVVSDWETVSYFGSVEETRKAITSTVEYANVLYREQLGIELAVTLTMIPASEAEDRVAKHTHPTFLHDALRAARYDDSRQLATDVTTLFTVRKLFMGSKAYAGYASQNHACAAGNVAIVSLKVDGLDGQTLAHELAHTLGASHDGDNPCETEARAGWLMSENSYAADHFSQCSINTIKQALAEFDDCMSVAQPAPPAPSSPSTQPTATPTSAASAGGSKGGGGAMDPAFLAAIVLVVALRFTSLRSKRC